MELINCIAPSPGAAGQHSTLDCQLYLVLIVMPLLVRICTTGPAWLAASTAAGVGLSEPLSAEYSTMCAGQYSVDIGMLGKYKPGQNKI